MFGNKIKIFRKLTKLKKFRNFKIVILLKFYNDKPTFLNPAKIEKIMFIILKFREFSNLSNWLIINYLSYI